MNRKTIQRTGSINGAEVRQHNKRIKIIGAQYPEKPGDIFIEFSYFKGKIPKETKTAITFNRLGAFYTIIGLEKESAIELAEAILHYHQDLQAKIRDDNNLPIEAAKNLLKLGHKISHKYYMEDEYIYSPKPGIIMTEDGYQKDWADFFDFGPTNGEPFKEGWRIYNPTYQIP